MILVMMTLTMSATSWINASDLMPVATLMVTVFATLETHVQPPTRTMLMEMECVMTVALAKTTRALTTLDVSIWTSPLRARLTSNASPN